MQIGGAGGEGIIQAADTAHRESALVALEPRPFSFAALHFVMAIEDRLHELVSR